MTGNPKTTLAGVLLVGLATTMHENQEMILSVVPENYRLSAQLIVGAIGLYLTAVGPSLGKKQANLRESDIPPSYKNFGPPSY